MSLSAREELQKTALLSNVGGLMLKWNEAVSDRADEDLMVRQDDEFCRKLRAALRAGTETCPVGVSTEPGTKRPILKLSTAWIKKTKPVARSFRRLSPNCGPPFCPDGCWRQLRVSLNEDDGGFH